MSPFILDVSHSPNAVTLHREESFPVAFFTWTDLWQVEGVSWIHDSVLEQCQTWLHRPALLHIYDHTVVTKSFLHFVSGMKVILNLPGLTVVLWHHIKAVH